MEIIKSLIYDYWKNIVIAILLLLLLSSCDVHKEAAKSKSDTDFKESVETKTFRKGDTVRYEIPNIIYKDTTIYRTNRQGSTLKTVYDQRGNIASIDCFASAIEEIKKENREFKQSLKNKEATKTENFDSSFIFYSMAALALVIFLALFLLYWYVKKNTVL